MLKRAFDFVLSFIGLIFFGFAILLFWFIASIDTKSNGFFIQKRIGQFGKPFNIIKLKSMRCRDDNVKTISNFGNFIRRTKIDEWPQLINVLIGEMSLVGPRPDIPGYYDLLEGEKRKILELKPGLTSLAAIKYFNEESCLAKQADPSTYNNQVIFPDKVQLNLDYYYNRSFLGDLKIIVKTFLGNKTRT
jgi:lipopolysaccharide/colanic/teichoic acid biosynthesis glycosyltransferase